jgi:hypothetical protein
MPATTPQSAWRVIKPTPKSAPTETCVVDTGRPIVLAIVTSKPVARLAAKPCPWFIAVIL